LNELTALAAGKKNALPESDNKPLTDYFAHSRETNRSIPKINFYEKSPRYLSKLPCSSAPMQPQTYEWLRGSVAWSD
jgi:hypothetical protein